jgi:hypothetical protein
LDGGLVAEDLDVDVVVAVVRRAISRAIGSPRKAAVHVIDVPLDLCPLAARIPGPAAKIAVGGDQVHALAAMVGVDKTNLAANPE